MQEKAIISIICLTYKHESYLEKALQGFFAQQTTFNYEVLICDDCSPDQTENVVANFKKNHECGYRLKYFRHEKNMGMLLNGIFALHQSTGKYIALCEGDDYWTDPQKLQRQVDFLEANDDYAICFHPANEITGNELPVRSNLNLPESPTSYTISDLANGNFLHTPTVVFRNLVKEFPAWYRQCPVGDYPLYLMLAKHGKIMYMPEVMCVYRIHNTSAWSSLSEINKWQKWRDMLEILLPNFEDDIKLKLQLQLTNSHFKIAALYQHNGELNEFGYNLSNALIGNQALTHSWIENHHIPLLNERKKYPGGVWVAFKHLLNEIINRIKRI